MPLVRIDLRKGRDAAFKRNVSRVVYEAMRAVGVPEEDRFQIINDHSEEEFVFSPTYLGIERSDQLVFIQITWNEGRTVDQKKSLFEKIASGLQAVVNLRPQDVFINLVEVKKENWSFGNGIAQYAV